jgi:hypothetical protein
MITTTAKAKPFSELFTFAFFPNYDSHIQDLAENLAQKEEWDFSDSPIKKFSILKNYLEFTFRKLKQEKKIKFTPDNKFSAFNTGLVTDNLEDIYCYFEKYKTPKAGSAPYCFKGFLKESDHQILRSFSHDLPEVADFFDKPEQLIFNPKYKLIPDLDHIIKDNLERFPAHLQPDEIDLRRQIIGAIDEVSKKARSNYKIAVPQYYDNKIQLLLPLSLTAGSPNPDLALVIHKLNETTYTSRTCLTLKMAYNNARLIVKPQSSWLKP